MYDEMQIELLFLSELLLLSECITDTLKVARSEAATMSLF